MEHEQHDRHRHHPRQIFVLGGALGSAVVLDWATRGLSAPPAGTIWAQAGGQYVLLDELTGDVLQVAAAPVPQQLFNVGIAWNAAGGWATRVAPTPAQAIASALEACSSTGVACMESGLSLSAALLGCYAIVNSGPRLYGAAEVTLQAAISAAAARCANDGNNVCSLQAANCNDHE